MDSNWGDREFSLNKTKMGLWNEGDRNVTADEDAVALREAELRAEYLRTQGVPCWAQNLTKSEEKANIVQGAVVRSRRAKKLVQSLAVANYVCQLPKPSASILFHPSQNLLLAAGKHKHFQLFNIDGDKNQMLKTAKIQNFPIFCAGYLKDGSELLFSSKTNYLYFYDIIKDQGNYLEKIKGRREKSWERFCVSNNGDKIAFIGDNGQIPIISQKSRQVVSCLNHGCPSISDIGFSRKFENILYTIGSEGSIFIWDISMTRCIKKVEMPQIFDANKICVSDNDLIAIGSNSGIVSLTDFSSLNSQPENLIIKDFKNITYPTSYICFNNKCQLMCYGSQSQNRGVRMIDLEEMSVLKNWPFAQVDNGIRKVFGADFSYDGKFLALGNSDGQILIHEIRMK